MKDLEPTGTNKVGLQFVAEMEMFVAYWIQLECSIVELILRRCDLHTSETIGYEHF